MSDDRIQQTSKLIWQEDHIGNPVTRYTLRRRRASTRS